MTLITSTYKICAGMKYLACVSLRHSIYVSLRLSKAGFSRNYHDSCQPEALEGCLINNFCINQPS